MTGSDSDRSLVGHFSVIEDPRDAIDSRHKLIDILVVAVAAVICGADTWVAVAQFGCAKERWLRTFLELPYGIPSHDTFGRVFAVLDPKVLEECFRAWAAAIRRVLPEEIVAIDGKSVRRSHDRGAGVGL